jgi:hypothetical protein
VQDQRDVLAEVERVEPCVKIAGVVHEPISAIGRGPGASHAHEIGGKAAPQAAHMGYDVAPEVRGGRVAVQEDDRIPLARERIAHFCVEDGDAPSRMRIVCVRNRRHRRHSVRLLDPSAQYGKCAIRLLRHSIRSGGLAPFAQTKEGFCRRTQKRTQRPMGVEPRFLAFKRA